MKRLYYWTLLFGLLPAKQVLQAQYLKDSNTLYRLNSYIKLTADAIGTYYGLEAEKKTGKISTISLFAGVARRYQIDDGWVWHTDAPIIIEPDTYAEYRNYYNFFNRVNKKRNTKNNSANFLFGRMETVFPVKNQNYFNLIFVEGWGTQRCIWRKIIINCHVGIAEHIYYDKPPKGGYNYVKLEPLATLAFSYLFQFNNH